MNKTVVPQAIGRRTFLKGAAAIAALGVLGDGVLGGPTRRLVEGAAPPSTGAEWKSSFCSGCHQPTCAIKVKVVNGVAVEIMGDPASATNKGKLCPRGNSLILNIYNPYRVKKPLKRTNPNRDLGEDPKFVEITWEEALSITAEKLGAVLKSDPKGLIYQTGFGREDERVPFTTAFGTPNSLPKNGTLCPEHYQALHLTGTTLDRLDLERANYVAFLGGTRGGGFVISDSSAHFTKAIQRGMKSVNIDPHYNNAARMGEWVPIRPGTETALGMALVYTIIHELNHFDEWWLKVRSNAVYLLPDTAPQVIRGTRVFMDDYVRDAATKKPLVWDTAANKAVPYDTNKGDTYALTGSYQVDGKPVKPIFQLLKEYITPFTPEWASEITTIPAATIRKIANDLVTEARIGSTIEIDGYKFPFRPASVDIRRAAAAHRMGTEAYKAFMIVNVLLGNSDVPGGIGGTSCIKTPFADQKFLAPDEDGVEAPPNGSSKSNQVWGGSFKANPDVIMKEFYPHYQGTGQFAWHAMAEPEKYYLKYPIKAYMVHAGNPIVDGCNSRYVQQVIKKLDFMVSIAYHIDDTTQLADIVLPESSILEATTLYRMFRNEKESIDSTRALTATLVRKPVVDQVYDARNANDIFIELCQRLGILEKLNTAINSSIIQGDKPGLTKEQALDTTKRYTWDEIVERKIKSLYGAQAGFKDFEACAGKFELLPTVKESYNYYYMPENKVRLPIYLARMPRSWKTLKSNLDKNNMTIPNQDMVDVERHYSAMPIWYESPYYGKNDQYPFYAIMWKDHFTNQNTVDRAGNPWLQEIIEDFWPEAKRILLPRKHAEELGIKEGEMIFVESMDGGKTQGRAHLSDLIHPECIGIGGNYGKLGLLVHPKAREGANYNVLLSPEEKYCDPVEGSIDLAPRVKIYKA